MSEDKVQTWLAQILSGLTSHPEQIVITRKDDEMGVMYTVDVHSEDIGKVIGKTGNVAKAMRTVLRSVGYFHGMRASMLINAPGSKFTPKEEEVDTAT